MYEESVIYKISINGHEGQNEPETGQKNYCLNIKNGVTISHKDTNQIKEEGSEDPVYKQTSEQQTTLCKHYNKNK